VRQFFFKNKDNPKVQCFTRKGWFFLEKPRKNGLQARLRPAFSVPVGVPLGHFSIALIFLNLLRKQVGAQALFVK